MGAGASGPEARYEAPSTPGPSEPAREPAKKPGTAPDLWSIKDDPAVVRQHAPLQRGGGGPDIVFNVKPKKEEAPAPAPAPPKKDPLRPATGHGHHGHVAKRFVPLKVLKEHGRLPRLGSNKKYEHPLTGEANANLCQHLEEFGPDTIFVFISHEWARPEEDPEVAAKRELLALPGEVRAAAATKHTATSGRA